MIRVLIADDHAVVRRGLVQIVGAEPDMAVIGEAGNAQELLALVRTQHADAVVLDISMPGKTGLEAIKELKQECPKLPVLVLSMHPEDQYAVRALKLGAAGYMTKESAPEELVNAIRKVISGRRYISANLAERLAVTVTTGADQGPHEALSDREFQVLCMIAGGKSISQIGDELSLSVKTISTYRVRILEKMSMKSNAELTRYAIQNNLVD